MLISKHSVEHRQNCFENDELLAQKGSEVDWNQIHPWPFRARGHNHSRVVPLRKTIQLAIILHLRICYQNAFQALVLHLRCYSCSLSSLGTVTLKSLVRNSLPVIRRMVAYKNFKIESLWVIRFYLNTSQNLIITTCRELDLTKMPTGWSILIYAY